MVLKITFLFVPGSTIHSLVRLSINAILLLSEMTGMFTYI